MKEKVKGGRRKGAGRKPSADPKQPVTIHVETSVIDSLGGKEGIQFLCYGAIYGEKRFPPSDLEVKQRGVPLPDDYVKIKKIGAMKSDGTVIKDVTKPAAALKPQKQPKTKSLPQINPEPPMAVSGAPKTLDELKSLCPTELTGLDRSEWIRTERQKYGI